ncbi:peptidoglycan-binding protein [Pseudomonas sp. 15FMM2]|uniref:Peptidoglycan-binding protein n=1 Tax=Pseudomonas imrae TaxID=2992837 RepID=A0ACC7PFE9_9PSED
MRKSLLVLLLWAHAVTATVPAPPKGIYPQSPRPLDSQTQQAIQRFLLHNRILDTPQLLDTAPYIVAAQAGRVLGASGERIYARGALDPVRRSYAIVRKGKVFTDPVSQELLGINLDDIGTACFVAAGDVTSLAVSRITQEIRAGDRLLDTHFSTDLSKMLVSAPAPGLAGTIIDVPRGVTQIGVLDTVILNRGKRDGLREGYLLAVTSTGAVLRDKISGTLLKTPDEYAGTLLVFRTYEKLSYGLVLRANRPLAVMDKFQSADPTQ